METSDEDLFFSNAHRVITVYVDYCMIYQDSTNLVSIFTDKSKEPFVAELEKVNRKFIEGAGVASKTIRGRYTVKKSCLIFFKEEDKIFLYEKDKNYIDVCRMIYVFTKRGYYVKIEKHTTFSETETFLVTLDDRVVLEMSFAPEELENSRICIRKDGMFSYAIAKFLDIEISIPDLIKRCIDFYEQISVIVFSNSIDKIEKNRIIENILYGEDG